MQTLYFKKKSAGGKVTLSDLPPNQDVQIVVLCAEPVDTDEEFNLWLKSLRARHPFAKMSKAEILKKLRATREQVWTERHLSLGMDTLSP